MIALVLAISLLDPSRVGRDGIPEGWQLMRKSGAPVVQMVSDGGRRGVCLDAHIASFSINRRVDVDPARLPHLRWTWRADVLPPRGDFRRGETDDQAAQLFVAFGRRGLATPVAINYIWDTNAAEGAVTESYVPVVVRIKTLVVASGTAHRGEWRTITRNILDDYRRLFGGEPPHVAAIRFQSNSQHSRSRARGCISEIAFE